MVRPDQKRGFTLLELMIVVAVIGIIAAIAIPNFLKQQARTKRAEVKVHLRTLFTAQRAFFAAKDRYSTLVSELGFAPERGNRYTYFVGAGALEARATADAGACATCTGVSVDLYRYPSQSTLPTAPLAGFTPGVRATSVGIGGTCPACDFLAMAFANIDTDVVLDVWTIGSESRTVGGVSVAAGEPAMELDDLDF